MILPKKIKFVKYSKNNSFLFGITLINHKSNKKKALLSLKINYFDITSNKVNFIIFQYEEFEIPKKINAKQWLFELFHQHKDKYNNGLKKSINNKEFNNEIEKILKCHKMDIF